MKMRCLFIVSLCVLSTEISTAQYLPHYDPPSPEASSLGKYAEHQVGYFTGTPNINIPLYEIKTGRIRVPISLSYHSGAIKVQDIPSRVGMGWTLNAGGVVTRTIRGFKDSYLKEHVSPEYYGFFHLISAHHSNPYGTVDYIYDLQPDLHFYNFNGRSGKFIFEDEEDAILAETENLLINGPYDGGIGFEITTEDGIVYKFQDIERTFYNDCKPTGYFAGSNPSAYYLSEIYDPVTNKTVTFHYTELDDFDYSITHKYTAPNTTSDNALCFGVGGNSLPCTATHTIREPKVLDYIEFDNGKVEFVTVDRDDVPGDKAYSEIIIKNDAGDQEKKFTFTYTYDYSLSECGSTPECKRLRLDQLNEKGTNNASLPPYKFDYKNENSLPGKNSAQQDIWGYFNDNGSNTFSAPRVFIYTNEWDKTRYLPFDRVLPGSPVVVSGQNRATDTSKVDYGVLNKITYPTGGYTTYTYESNEFHFRNGSSYDQTKKYKGGGIRIKNIKDYSASGSLAKTTEFTYDKGFLGGALPQVGYPTDLSGNYSTNMIRFSSNKAILGANQGGIVGYQKVTEKITSGGVSNGYTVYTYLDEVDEVPTITVDQSCAGSSIISHLLSTTYFPYFEMESHESERGLLEKIEYFDNSLQLQVKEIVYDYELASEDYEIRSSKEYEDYYSTASHQNLGTYYYKIQQELRFSTEKMLLLSETDRDYLDQDGLNKSKKITYTYYNDPLGINNLALHTKSELTGQGHSIETEYKYPFNFAGTASGGVMGRMGDPSDANYMHYVSPVIQELVFKREGLSGKWLLSSKITDYADGDPGIPVRILPKKIYATELTTPATTGYTVSDPSGPPSMYKQRVEFKEYSYSQPTLIEYDDHFQRLTWANNDKLASSQILRTSGQYTFLLPPQGYDKVTSTSSKTLDSYYTYSLPSSFPNLIQSPQGTYYISLWAKSGTFTISELGTTTAPGTWTRYAFKFQGDEGPIDMSGTAQIASLRLSVGASQITTYHYDKFDRLVAISDPANSITTFEYDVFGRLINQKDTNDDIEVANYYNFK